MRARRAVAALGALALLAPACGKKQDTDARVVRDLLQHTARLPRGLVSTEASTKGRVDVVARIEDDLRYKASVSVDGAHVLDEVVVDDALAERVLDPKGFRAIGATTAPGVLATGRWVLDRYGAPSLLPTDLQTLRVGDDAVLDALTAFRHVDRVIRENGGIHKFDPDSLAYRPREDPFPRPDHGAGELRYDVERPPLPRPGAGAGGAASRVLPGPQHFRKLSVYVRDGRVVRIREQVAVGVRLRELERVYDLGLPAAGTSAQRAALALGVINTARRVTGQEPVRERTLDLRIVETGRSVTVALPEDAIEASLRGLPHRGDNGGGAGA